MPADHCCPPAHLRRRGRGPRAPWATLALGVGAMLLPKCPICLAAYLSLLGLGAAAGSLAPLLFPLGALLVALSFASLAYVSLCRTKKIDRGT